MSISTGRLFSPPEVEVDFLGFTASGWALQRAGWKFEEMTNYASAAYPFGRGPTIIMRHPRGISAQAECSEPDYVHAIDHMAGHRRERPILFVVNRVTSKPSELRFAGPMDYASMRLSSLDMDPYPREARARREYRWSLADVLGRESEEIIVEPRTVAGLLEEIKQMQAPELAEIRRRNRVRDNTRHLEEQPLPEWREEVSAKIITMRKAA